MAEHTGTGGEAGRTPSRLVFEYVQSPLFRTIYADGVLGSLSPTTDAIRLTFFNEHFPLPQRTVHAFNPDGTLGEEIEKERISKEGVVREFEVDVVLSTSAAEQLLYWLTVTSYAEPAPLRKDETGAIRVGPSRVTLDVVLADYRSGLTPEEIVRQLDTLNLADVYAAIAYYHRHRDEVERYLRRREDEATALRREIEASQPDRAELKARLLSRLAQGDGGHAPAGQ